MAEAGVRVLVERLSRRWGDFDIRDVSLCVEPGEYFCVLGPTGGGKTLLLELLAGFHAPDGGAIRFDGTDVTRLPPEKRGAGFVYQQFMLFPHLGVFDNIAFGLHVRRMPLDEMRRRVEDVAGQVGIEHLLDREVGDLSGGEQQRVSLARALALGPRLLLLDEPTSSVDPPTREGLLGLLRRIHRQTGVTVIHVTHDRQEAIALADRIAVLNEGRLAEVGVTEEVFRRPQSEFVARFLGSENIYRGKARRHGSITEITVGKTKMQALKTAEGDVSVTIRPEDVILAAKRMKTSARNVLKGRIVELADMGALVKVTMDCGLPLVVYVTRQSFKDMGLTVGNEVYAYFKAQGVHVFER